jgi:hypothetical protein
MKEATGIMRAYWAAKNATSINGLPAFIPATWETTDAVTESAPDRRVATVQDDEESYAAAKAAALVEAFPAAGPVRERVRVDDREQKVLVAGFVLGLIAASLMDRLATRLR